MKARGNTFKNKGSRGSWLLRTRNLQRGIPHHNGRQGYRGTELNVGAYIEGVILSKGGFDIGKTRGKHHGDGRVYRGDETQ